MPAVLLTSVLPHLARALALVLAVAAAPALAANCTAPVADGQLYSIASVASRKVLDIESGSSTAGGAVQQWGYAGSANQQFYVRSLGNGYWTIQARHSGMLIDVSGQATSEGARVLQWPATSGYNQQWQLKKSTTGAYNVVARHSGKSLTVADSNFGTRAHQAADTASGLQRWFFNPVSGQCGDGASGFAAQGGSDGLSTTTGGGTAPTVTVNSCSALASALRATAPGVVQVAAGATIDCRTAERSQSACAISCPSYQDPGKTFYRIPVGAQTCRELGSGTDTRYSRTRNETTITVASNKTLIGLSATSRIIGASFNLGNAKNVIVKNLTIENVNPGLIEAGDAITLNNSSHIWIDRVRFNLISDGHVDIQNSKNVTLSWNRFDGLNPAVCGGKHHYTSAINNSQVTLHHNFWNKASGRNPKLDGAATRAHLYNNYWLDITYFAVNASNAAQARLDANFFANSARPHWAEGGGLLDASLASNRYTGVSASDSYRHTGARVFGDLTLYAYTADPVDQVPVQVGQGAGPR